MQPTNWSANGVFLAEEGLEVRRGLGGRTDGRFGSREVGSGSADTVAPRSRECSGSSRTRLWRIRPLGYDATTSTSDWCTFFASGPDRKL